MQISQLTGRRTAFVLLTLAFLLLTQFSTVRAEGYQLSQNLQPNQQLNTDDYRLSSDGKYVVYRIITFEANYQQRSQLFSVNTVTKQRKALTSLVGGAGKFIGGFDITPNSQYVIFNASLDQTAGFHSQLYSIPIAANANQRINISDVSTNAQANIFVSYISPDSLNVVYLKSEQTAAGESFATLHRVSPTGGATTQLTPRVAGTGADFSAFAPDSSRFIYIARAADGSGKYKSVKLDGTETKTLTDREERLVKITPDSARIVFVSNSSPNGDGEDRLYSITLAGNGPRKKLSKNGEHVFDFQFANGSPAVVYDFKPSAVEGSAPTAFGFVPADRSEEPVSYNTSKEITNYAVSPNNGSIIYTAGQNFGPSQLYSLTYQNNFALDQQISNAPANQAAFSRIYDFKVTPDSQRVIFHAIQGDSYPPDLFSTTIANNPVAVKLNTLPAGSLSNVTFSSYLISPNSQRVIFGFTTPDGNCCADDLYTNSVAGGTPTGAFATDANNDYYRSSLRLTADGQRVIYTKNLYDEFRNYLSSTLWAANVPQ